MCSSDLGLRRRVKRLDVDEDVLELARVDYHTGRWAWTLGDRERAVAAFEQGLAHAEAFGERTGTPVTVEWLRLVQALAQARFVEGVSPDKFRRDVSQDVRRAHEAVGRNRNPRWENDRFLLEQYRVLAERDADGSQR